MFSLTRREQIVVALLVASLVVGGGISLWDRFSPEGTEDFQVVRVAEPPEALSGEVDSEKVHLNTASAEDLERLPRIGPKMAQKILRWRTDHGPFRTVEDLAEIPGIGKKTIDEIRDMATF
ncbi:MAG: helix-hairpin-helix domain-containing protein [Candidatus Latescibacteria bacterium]|nr:helix-hairpin-helix domain-containing protein [Candidatus Latescibacterota bacterium]